MSLQSHTNSAQHVLTLADMESPSLNESDTDDSFMKRIIMHNRSQSEDVLRPQAFSRAQVRPRNSRLTLANLERLPIPEPPQVTTKSDLGSIESRSSSERSRNKLESIRQRELEFEDQDEDEDPDGDQDRGQGRNQARDQVQDQHREQERKDRSQDRNRSYPKHDGPAAPAPAPLSPPPSPPAETRQLAPRPVQPAQRTVQLAQKTPQEDEGSDLIHIRNMGNHLRSLSANLEGVRTGMDNISKMTGKPPNGTAGGELPVHMTDKEIFGAVSRAIWASLWVSRHDSDSWGHFRLGPGFWLLWLLAVPVYAVLECIMCMVWCRPVFADSMEGLGISPDAPEMPFVIPTMLLRPLRPIWKPLLQILASLLCWLWDFIAYVAANGRGYVL